MTAPIRTKANAQDRYIHHDSLLVSAYMLCFIFLLQSYLNSKSEQTFQIPAVTPPPALTSFSKEGPRGKYQRLFYP